MVGFNQGVGSQERLISSFRVHETLGVTFQQEVGERSRSLENSKNAFSNLL